jgi:hypothetical protein
MSIGVPAGGLLAAQVDLREMYGDSLPEACEVFTQQIGRLTRGEAYRLHGWELPDDHPAQLIYGINADLVLTEDDELVPIMVKSAPRR